MVLAGGPLGGHQGGALMNEIIKDLRELPHPFCDVRTQPERLSMDRKWALTKHPICQCLDLGLPGFQNWEK